MKKTEKIIVDKMQHFPKVAICYDFDGTLISGNMQENSFIPNIGMCKEKFWKEVKVFAEKNDMDEVLAYMYYMIEKAKEKGKQFTKKTIKKLEKPLVFFPGIGESGAWFSLIRSWGEKLHLNIQHFIISSGLDEVIKASLIHKHIRYVFASGFIYDNNDVPIFPARAVNYTAKTQYLFRINKGCFNSADDSINKVMDEKDRPFPFSRMIYIGDGESDVPAMKMINYQGGYSIAVWPFPVRGESREAIAKKKETVQLLYKDNRVQFTAQADYKEGSPLYRIVTAILQRISDELQLQMNLSA